MTTQTSEREPAPFARLNDAAFVVAVILALAGMCVLMPRYFPLMEPDSAGYVNFAANRTAYYPYFLRGLSALGIGYGTVIYVQVALFCAAVAVLLGALLRWGVGRWWIFAFIAALGANAYFTSFQRTLMTESIGFSALIVATAFLIDYLRTGRVVFFAAASLCTGAMIGIRPAGLAILPMLLAAALLNRKRVSLAVALLVATVSTAAGWLPERVLYRMEFGGRTESITPFILSGKAAMLARPDNTFSGPHAAALQQLAAKLTVSYEPVHTFIGSLPSLVYRPVMVSFYEGAGQFLVIDRDVARLAAKEKTTPDALRSALGWQVIGQNIPGFLRLSAMHYVGQWSIAARTFPPAANAVAAYAERTQPNPLRDIMTDLPFTPQSDWRSSLIYPIFILAGFATFALSIRLLLYLFWPPEPGDVRAQSLMLAAFLAGLCHVSMILTSIANVSTPRFLMMVYPHILLSLVFLLRAWLQNHSRKTKSSSYG